MERLTCLLLVSSCLWLADATRLPLELQAEDAFVCGAPNGPCGKDIPASVTCDKGQGWCQPGYYCGSSDNTMVGPSKCLEIPKDCGLPGKPCCPSNANRPHTSVDDKLKKQPFCKNGATCFFYEPTTDKPEVNNGDIFAANTGGLPVTQHRVT